MNTPAQILRDVAMLAESRPLRRPGQGSTAGASVQGAGSLYLQPSAPALGSETSLSPYGRPELSSETLQHGAQQKDLEALSAAEFERGREQGYEQGVQEGIAQMQQQLEHRAAQLATSLAQEQIQQAQAHFQREANQQIEQLHAQLVPQYELLVSLIRKVPLELERRLAEAEEDVVALTFEVICKVMGEKAATPEGLTGLVKATAKNWHGRSALEIHLHPDDWEMLQSHFSSAEQSATDKLGLDGQELRWVADSTVALGGCMLQSSEGILDARLELQMVQLQSSLLRTRAERKRTQALMAQEGPA